jgi:hypothetical protein
LRGHYGWPFNAVDDSRISDTLNIYLDGDPRKTLESKVVSSNVGSRPPTGPTLTAGRVVNNGRSVERTEGRWQVPFNDLDDMELIDPYTSYNGGYWVYTSNEEFGKIDRARFYGRCFPIRGIPDERGGATKGETESDIFLGVANSARVTDLGVVVAFAPNTRFCQLYFWHIDHRRPAACQ